MSMVIGRPMGNANACGIMSWEMAVQFGNAADNLFMDISQEAGEELYKAARTKTAVVFPKFPSDVAVPNKKNIVDIYLPSYTHKVVVEGDSVEKFLGHYSLVTTVHPFAAGILFIKRAGDRDWSSVLCVVSGENRPTYIFDPASGTLERTENLYSTLFSYIPDNVTMSAYIVSKEAAPIVFATEEPTPQKENVLVEEEEEEEEEAKPTPKKRGRKTKKDAEEEPTKKPKKEEEEAPKKKGSSKKRERSPPPKEEDTVPTVPLEEEKDDESSHPPPEDAPEKKPRKRPGARRRKLAEVKMEVVEKKTE